MLSLRAGPVFDPAFGSEAIRLEERLRPKGASARRVRVEGQAWQSHLFLINNEIASSPVRSVCLKHTSKGLLAMTERGGSSQ
jgi:hypothetical protein